MSFSGPKADAPRDFSKMTNSSPVILRQQKKHSSWTDKDRDETKSCQKEIQVCGF